VRGRANEAQSSGTHKAAKPQSARLSAIVGDIQTVGIGAGRPAPLRVTAIVGDTPDLSAALRLCARQTTPPRPPPARRADRRHTRTGRAEPQSRRALTSSAIVGDIQTVGAGRPAPLRVTAIVGDTPDLSAALRLCARKTTPRRPPPARRADRRHTRTGRAEPQSRSALTSSAIVGDIPLRLRGSFPHASKQRFQALTPPTFSAPPTPPPTSPCPAAPRRPLGTGAGSRPPRSLRRGVAPSPRGEAPD
jgi:hypothetical protein